MQTRGPIVAGQFYPGQHDECIDQMNGFIEPMELPEQLPGDIAVGIVPHAGWMFSGELAAMVFEAIRQQDDKVHTFVIFGAAHSYFSSQPAVYDRGSWATPLGEVAIDEDFARAILDTGMVVSDVSAHHNEHSIEVQVPFIQYLFAGAKIVPILVPVVEGVADLGLAVSSAIKAQDNKIVCIGSTDLTHYGPKYGFVPMGAGDGGLKWAHDVNDREFIDLALKLETEAMLTNSVETGSACGGGAAATAVAAAKGLGKEQGLLLGHTNSNEVMRQKMGTISPESVGYAAIVY
ncbi:AmmeMemoRadiSam system protein B [Planctomycetota bacterium]